MIVERVALPPDIRRGEPFDLRVVITNTATGHGKGPRRTSPAGWCSRARRAGGPTPSATSRWCCRRAKRCLRSGRRSTPPNFYTYEARFVPDRPEDDALPQNNRATAFTHIQGKGQVLLIEDHEHPGEFAVLVDRLRRQGLEVEVQPSDQCFSTPGRIAALRHGVAGQRAPREQFSDGQIAMLARNTQQMGAGLVMLGGPNSFGAGGWTDTEVEQAMPVDFQIKSSRWCPRRAGDDHACQRDRRGRTIGKRRSPARPSRPSVRRTTAA